MSFDPKFHAKQNPAATRRDTQQPCAICGWSERMAIHDVGNRHVKGYGHAYRSAREAIDAATRPALDILQPGQSCEAT